MRRILLAVAIIASLSASRPLEAQFHFARRDSLPERVVQRALDGFNHHDVVAIEAEYDSVYVHENMADMAGPRLVSRTALRDSLVLSFLRVKDVKVKLSRRTLAGALVADLYVTIENGKKTKHLDIYEVRHGKIVREWEY